MTELTLEELAELDAFVVAANDDHVATLILQERLLDAAPSLLAMARELIRLKSALDHLERLDSGQGQHFWEPSEIYRSAKHWGWLDPLSPPATPVAESEPCPQCAATKSKREKAELLKGGEG